MHDLNPTLPPNPLFLQRIMFTRRRVTVAAVIACLGVVGTAGDDGAIVSSPGIEVNCPPTVRTDLCQTLARSN